jgi:hypothetical protein
MYTEFNASECHTATRYEQPVCCESKTRKEARRIVVFLNTYTRTSCDKEYGDDGRTWMRKGRGFDLENGKVQEPVNFTYQPMGEDAIDFVERILIAEEFEC